jgi:hypothetical protein
VTGVGSDPSAGRSSTLDDAGSALPPPGDAKGESAGGLLFWAGLVLGWAVMSYAVVGLRAHADDTNPAQLARWVLGAAVVHDALVAPVVTITALVLVTQAPRWWGRPVGFAAAVSTILVLFSIPLVRGYGRRVNNPSALPHDYTANLVWTLVSIWTATAAVIVSRAIRRRGSR